MEFACISFHWSFWWTVVYYAWIFSATGALWYWSQYERNQSIELFRNYPHGTDSLSLASWIFYTYASLSQFSFYGLLIRIFSPRLSRLILDVYEFGWVILALWALHNPDRMDVYAPLFVWRFLEYTATAMLQRIFRTGFPPRLEARPERYRLGYRALLIDIINYLGFAIFFAALYRANSGEFGTVKPEWAMDAFYFSITTMTTLGYGDFVPVGCVRQLVSLQVLFGIFMVAILVGVLIGQRVLFIPRRSTLR